MKYVDHHHHVALLNIANASLQLISLLPETDAVTELAEILEELFDIVDCMISDRHFGSDGLDFVIRKCGEICAQIKEHETK